MVWIINLTIVSCRNVPSFDVLILTGELNEVVSCNEDTDEAAAVEQLDSSCMSVGSMVL